jgi:hypothetical protein
MVLPYPQDADGEIQEISFLVVCFMATAAWSKRHNSEQLPL